MTSEKPILLPNTKTVETSLRILDRIFCYETHKVGVVYVGQGQTSDEASILVLVWVFSFVVDICG